MAPTRTEAQTSQPHPTPWTLSSIDDPLYLVSKIGNLGTKLFADALQELGLRPRHVAALRFIAHNSGVPQRDLVAGLWSDSSSVVALLDDFSARGLAERRPNPTDRRAYSIYLTDEGFEVLAEAEKLSKQASDTLFEQLNVEEREVLGGLLKRIVAGNQAE